MSAAGKASGSRSSRIAMYCAVHSPTPGSWRSRAMAASRLPLKARRPDRSRPQRQAPDRAAARAFGMPSAARFARASRAGRGKTCVSPAVANRGSSGIAVLHDEAAGERACAAHRDLLTENGADRELEAVPGAGHPQSRTREHAWREHGVLDELLGDGLRIGAEIEHAAQPRDDRRQRRELGESNRRRGARCPGAAAPRRAVQRRRSRSCAR